MWSMYLGILALLLPDLIYLVFEVDTNPRIWVYVALALFAYGIIGRIKSQGIAE